MEQHVLSKKSGVSVIKTGWWKETTAEVLAIDAQHLVQLHLIALITRHKVAP